MSVSECTHTVANEKCSHLIIINKTLIFLTQAGLPQDVYNKWDDFFH